LVRGGYVEHALLDLGIAGDLGELPILGGYLAKKVFAISHQTGLTLASACFENASPLAAAKPRSGDRKSSWLRRSRAIVYAVASNHDRFICNAVSQQQKYAKEYNGST
jgi:hypothetical protein